MSQFFLEPCSAHTLHALEPCGAHSVMAQVWLVVSSEPEKRPAISGVSAPRASGSPVRGSTMRFRQAHMLLSLSSTGPRACVRQALLATARVCILQTRNDVGACS